MTTTPTPRTDAEVEELSAEKFSDLDAYMQMTKHARELERDLAEVTAAIHKVHPTRRGSLVDMVEDLESYRETAMNALRISHKALDAERELADRLLAIAEKAVSDHEGTLRCDCDCKCSGRRIANDSAETLTAWKEARRGTV